MRNSGRYRQDIDGLRAIAVLLVTFFHINETLIPGGFVGVDVFFVISGYLITGNIVRERRDGSFTFAEFYRRRTRRILPAMFAVTFATLAAGAFVMLPQDAEQLAWSSLATVFSAANIYFTFFLETGYFAADSATVPLLHMWSLGVEEQFYLVWPIAVIGLLALGRATRLACIALVVVASVAAGEWLLSSGHLEWAYYMLPSRAFQLAIGGALVFLPALTRYQAPVTLLGLSLVIGSAFVLDAHSAFPGVNALPVTIGTALMLVGGGSAGAVTTALSWQPIRWFGLISYSLYLWHWPVLAFQRYLYGDLSMEQQVGSFALMVALAYLSFRFIEEPARHSRQSLSIIVRRMVLAPSAALCLSAVATISMGQRSADANYDFADVRAANHGLGPTCDYRSGFERLVECRLSDEPRAIVWGDSFAMHVIPALTASGADDIEQATMSACPPALDFSWVSESGRYAEPWARRCINFNAEVFEHITRSESVETVIIAAQFNALFAGNANLSLIRSNEEFTIAEMDPDNAMRAFETTIRKLQDAGKEVVLISTPPSSGRDISVCVERELSGKLVFANVSCSITVEADRSYYDQTLIALADMERKLDIAVIDFREWLCKETCSTSVNGVPLYRDAVHLSVMGSAEFGRSIDFHRLVRGR